MNFNELPKFTRNPSYRISVEWRYLEDQIESWTERAIGSGIASVNLNPDFQRLHVWTPEQQTKYVEYVLSGGSSGREIYFNCNGWRGSYKGPFVLVDGKQRLEAARQFLNNHIRAFGHLYKEFEGRLPYTADFYFNVNDLPTYAEVIQWYLEMNSGGTPHTPEEIQKAKDLLALQHKQ